MQIITNKESKWLQLLLNNSNVGILIVDKNREILLVNHHLCEMFGYEENELLGQYSEKLHASYETSTEFAKQAFDFLLQGKAVEIEYQLKKRDGTLFWAHISGDTNEEYNEYVWTIADVTQRVEEEKSIRAKKERMELALFGSKAGALELNLLDAAMYYSSQWKRMLGYKNDELPTLLSTWENLVHPSDAEPLMPKVQKAIDAKMENIEITHRLKHLSGEWIWVTSKGLIQYDSDGKAFSVVGIATDITKQKNIELTYVQQGQIIEQIHDSVVTTDVHGSIMTWNHGSEILYGYKADEVLGKHISLIHLEEDLDSFRINIESVLKYGEYNTEFRAIKKSKDLIDIDLSLSLLKDEKGEYAGIVGYAQDITKRKKAEAAIQYINENLQKEVDAQIYEIREQDLRLLQQSKLAQMGDMVGMIAHQWRQPLNAISGTVVNLSLLSKMAKLEPQIVEKSSSFIQDQCQNMSSIIETFINFAKPEKESALFKISHAVDESMVIIGAQLKRHNIKTAIKSTSENISIIGHEDLLEQVIINILSNMKDAFDDSTVQEKLINITMRRGAALSGSNVPIIMIEDNAGGVPKEIREKIFNPYFTTKEQGKGTGIGLYMSMKIMKERFDGDLIYSPTDDGSCFTIVCDGVR